MQHQAIEPTDPKLVFSQILAPPSGKRAPGLAAAIRAGEALATDVEGRPAAIRVWAATPKHLRLIVAAARAVEPDVVVEQPTVLRRATVLRMGEGEHAIGATGATDRDFAVVRLRVVPRRAGDGNEFESEFAGPAMIDALNQAVARGVDAVTGHGMAGSGRIVDTRIVFIDGAFHPTRSTPGGFEAAGKAAMLAACRAAGLQPLVPIMQIEIEVARDDVLPIVAALARLGGREARRSLTSAGVRITAEVPAPLLLDVEPQLSGLAGRGARVIGEALLIRWAPAIGR